MNRFREKPENAYCAWCGRNRKLEVHHIVPVSVDGDRAADEDNMIMLCRKPACHLVVGHNGNFRQSFVENVRQVCSADNQRIVRVIDRD